VHTCAYFGADTGLCSELSYLFGTRRNTDRLGSCSTVKGLAPSLTLILLSHTACFLSIHSTLYCSHLTMFSSKEKSDASDYKPVALRDDGDDLMTSSEKCSSSEDDRLLEDSDNLRTLASHRSLQLPKLILYLTFTLLLLSTANVALLPTVLSKYRAYPYSDADLEALPYGDARLGLDRAAKVMAPPQVYHRSWPDRIARVSRRLKNAVWGQGVQVYITVEVRMTLLSPDCFKWQSKYFRQFCNVYGCQRERRIPRLSGLRFLLPASILAQSPGRHPRSSLHV
jgi:hypothetical protein